MDEFGSHIHLALCNILRQVCVCIMCLTSSQMFCGPKDLASIEEFHLGQIVAGLLKHYDRWQ